MKTSQVQVVLLTFCVVVCSMVLGSQLNTTTQIVSPSPTIQPTSMSFQNSSSPTPHNSSSPAHRNHSSSIHHNGSSTIHHNMSSSIHSNHSSSIMPSPSVNHSITINATSMIHSASHMTYTISPSHSISPNATSTVMPSSSSVVPPTTPPPTPKWPKGKFSVEKGNNSCLLMWLSMEFIVKYKNESSGEVLSFDVIMPNSSSATASGTCGNEISTIRIEWEEFYYLDAAFETVKTADFSTDQYHWTTKNLTLYAKLFNNSAFVDGNKNETEIKETISDSAKLEWLSGLTGNSLNCSQKQTVKFGNSIEANFENVRIQPFAVEKDKFSNKVDVCMKASTTTTPPTTTPPKNSDNTVAIAVGCSLGGLVLIVLIGYLIGKRRKNSIRYRKL